MRLLLRVLRWLLIVVVVLALLIGSGGYLWLRSALPQTAGTIKVQGISAPVEILRDSDAVPHIRAQTEADATFGLGYVHAQDRLWQMEFQRRIGNGRLSEILGDATLATDRFLRTLGTARAAASAWRRLNPEARKLIEAYVAGINAFISTHHGRELPIEFTILGFEPEPWRPEDVLVWAKMMAWNLGGNWDNELLRTRLTARLGADKAAQLMPSYSADGPIILPDGVAVATTDHRPTTDDRRPPTDDRRPTTNDRRPTTDDRRQGDKGTRGQGESKAGQAAICNLQSAICNPREQSAICNLQSAICNPREQRTQYDGLMAINRTIQEALGLGGTGIGSNNWVIGGARTTTGKPLLANDPHLAAQIPSIWYLAHISGGKLDVIGATLPGTPGVIIGHNQNIAWGVTNTDPDVQDLFIEHVNDRGEVEHNGTWEPMQIIPELIKVKGQPDVSIRVRITRHGPLISDAIEPGLGREEGATSDPLAFRWTALDEEDHTLEAFMRLAEASNWQQFTRALEGYQAPMQNFVYADVDGNIGYYAPGALPIRAKGDGTLPASGWTGEYDWRGYVPFAELPHAYNPPQGFIVSANNKVAPDNYPHFITSGYAAPYRAARIVELIQAKDKLSPDDVAAMQADQRSAQARELLPYLLQAKVIDGRTKAAIDFLRGWDGTISGDSAQAALYEAWYLQIPAHIFADELGEKLWDDYAGQEDLIAMALPGLLKGNGASWCDDIRTPQLEDCPTALGGALYDGLAQMAKYQGADDFTTWRWDRVHRTIFPHNPFDKVDALKPIFSRSIPNGGDGFTIDVGPIERNDLYNQLHVPSYRQIIDLANLRASRFMHTVGQSGQVLSGDYSNLIDRWQRVGYLPMRYDQEAINAAAAGRLMLEP